MKRTVTCNAGIMPAGPGRTPYVFLLLAANGSTQMKAGEAVRVSKTRPFSWLMVYRPCYLHSMLQTAPSFTTLPLQAYMRMGLCHTTSSTMLD